MLGSILNTLLIPVYVVCVIAILALSIVTRIVGEVARLLELICELLGDFVKGVVDFVSML